MVGVTSLSDAQDYDLSFDFKGGYQLWKRRELATMIFFLWGLKAYGSKPENLFRVHRQSSIVKIYGLVKYLSARKEMVGHDTCRT